MTVAAATDLRLRAMEPGEWSEVADLIYVSLNYWCEANGRPALKLSDNPNKAMGEPSEIARYLRVFGSEGRVELPVSI